MNKKMVTIEGIVDAVEWDDAGNITMVSIIVDRDEEYLVVNNKEGWELLEREGDAVRATGTLEEGEFGETMISLSSFKILDDDYIAAADDDYTAVDDGDDGNDDFDDDEDDDDDFDDDDYNYRYSRGDFS